MVDGAILLHSEDSKLAKEIIDGAGVASQQVEVFRLHAIALGVLAKDARRIESRVEGDSDELKVIQSGLPGSILKTRHTGARGRAHGRHRTTSEDKVENKGLSLQLANLQKLTALIDHGEVGNIFALFDILAAAHRGSGLMELLVNIASGLGTEAIQWEDLLQIPLIAEEGSGCPNHTPFVANG